MDTEIVGCPIKKSLNEEPIIFWLKLNSRYDGNVTKTAFQQSVAIILHLVFLSLYNRLRVDYYFQPSLLDICIRCICHSLILILWHLYATSSFRRLWFTMSFRECFLRPNKPIPYSELSNLLMLLPFVEIGILRLTFRKKKIAKLKKFNQKLKLFR